MQLEKVICQVRRNKMNRINISKEWLEGLIKAGADVQMSQSNESWQWAYLIGYIQSAKEFLNDKQDEFIEISIDGHKDFIPNKNYKPKNNKHLC